MMTEPNTAQSIVDGQLAELQITSTEVTGDTYREQHDAKIAALAEEEAALPVPKDKATLQVVQDFITKSEKARTGIDKWRKAFKDQWKKIIDPVDAYVGTNKESGMQARIYAIQERAEAKKKAYLDEQAKAAREAERLLEERYQARFNKLVGAGMLVDAAGSLTIRDGEQTLSALPAQLRFATDEQMAAVLAKVETIRAAQIEREEAARQAKEAEERERVEEANRLAIQKRVQEAEAAKLKAEREAFEKERSEHAAKMKAEQDQKEWDAQIKHAADRGEELRALDAEQYEDGSWHLGVIEGDPEVTQADLREMTSDEWAPVLARFKEAAEARDSQPIATGNDDDTFTPPSEWAKRVAENGPPENVRVITVVTHDEAGQIPEGAMDAIREATRKVFDEPHNEAEYRADVAKATTIIVHDELDAGTLAKYRDLLLAVEYPADDALFRQHNVEIVADLRKYITDRLTQ
jgi:hypothetical protein